MTRPDASERPPTWLMVGGLLIGFLVGAVPSRLIDGPLLVDLAVALVGAWLFGQLAGLAYDRFGHRLG